MHDQQWTVVTLASSGAEVLAKRGFESARLESDLLLARVLGLERLELYTRFDMPVDNQQRGAFRELIKRRLAHEPVAYILGEREFLDLTFEVGAGVLIPRPETEHVVHAGSTFLANRESPRFVEVGVGSGCIALSLLHAHKEAVALGVDTSDQALEMTRKNAERLGLIDRLTLVKSDVFSALETLPQWTKDLDLLISNPPYIRRNETRELAADVLDFEPHEALFCADDGFLIHRRILESGDAMIGDDGGVVLELNCDTGEAIVNWATRSLPGTLNAVLPDYAELDRVFCHTKMCWPPGFSGLHGANETSRE